MEKIEGVSIARLSLIIKTELVPIFFQLLGHGFKLNVQIGCSVKELLCNQLGIHEDYLTERIQTIFLNAKVVDDVKSANVNEGSVLALSGAMPGLVGAILRSGGIYAGMRSQISHNTIDASPQNRPAQITLKLLNLVVKELGPSFLQKGVGINGSQLKEFIGRNWDGIKSGCLAVEWNDQPCEPDRLPEIDYNADLINLRVSAEPDK